MTEKEETTKKETKPFISYFTFILSVLALAISIVTYQKHLSLSKHQLKKVVDNQDVIREIKLSTDNLLEKQQANLKTKKQLLTEVQKIKRQRLLENNAWPLIKAKHLVERAHLALKWDESIKPTIAMLSAADNLLRQQSTIDSQDVRNLLLKAISSLEALNPIDTIGILSKIDSVETVLYTLPLKGNTTSTHQDKHSPEKTTDQEGRNWKSALNTSLNKLSKLVVIRYREDSSHRLIPSQEKKLLIRSISLSLQEAKWALIRHNQALFNYSIKHALLTISDHFKAENHQVEVTIKTLNTLLTTTKLKRKLPELNPIIKLIDGLISQNLGKGANL